MNRKIFIIAPIIVLLFLFILIYTRYFKLNNKTLTSSESFNESLPIKSNTHVASSSRSKEVLSLGIGRHEAENVRERNNEETNQKSKDREVAKLEEEQIEKYDVISPEYLSIGMILDPNEDIPGAKYITVTSERSGTKVKVPVNLPEGYSAIVEECTASPGLVLIVPKDSNFTTIQIERNINGDLELIPPEEAWSIYKELESLKKRLDSLPRESEEWKKVKLLWDKTQEYGKLTIYTSVYGEGNTTIIYGSDGKGWYRSIVNP